MRRSAFLISTASVMALSTAAMAQTEVGEIVVTGTRIVQDGFEAPTPVTVMTVETLRSASPVTLSDALNQLPQFSGSQTLSALQHGTGGNTSDAGNYLTLRNLGPNRNLTMIDGRRTPPSNIRGLVDSGIVPELLVERVDVVTGGVSAVYGSDAITGVINYILDRDFTGLKFQAQFGVSDRSGKWKTADLATQYPERPQAKFPWLSDGKSYRLGAAGGFDVFDGRGHVLASFERSKQGRVERLARPHADEAWAFIVNSRVDRGGEDNPWILTPNVIRNNLAYSGKFIDGGPGITGWEIDQEGNLRVFDEGYVTGVTGISVGGDSGRPQPQQGLRAWAHPMIPSLKTDQAYLEFNYDVSDKVNATFSAIFSDSFATINGGASSLINYWFALGNPFIPELIQERMIANGTERFRFSRRKLELVPGNNWEDNDGLILTAGLRGEFGEGWNFDAFYTHGETNQHETSNTWSFRKRNASLDAVIDPVTGAIVCRVLTLGPDIAARYPGCVPYNPFGLDEASDAAKAYEVRQSQKDAKHETDYVGLSVSGDLFSTWAGPIGVAAGGEYRKQRLDIFSNVDRNPDYTGLRPELLKRLPLTTGGEAHGGTNVKEVFGEIAVPLARDVPGVYELELTGAARLTDYSNTGRVTTWKAGLSYEPIPDLRFRGAWSRDIRAPTLVELFAEPSGRTGGNVLDHFTGQTESTGTQVSGGNPDVRPEIGTTKTVGVVFRPQSIPNLGISVDWFDIRIKGAINTLNAQGLMDDCFASGGLADSCDQIQRPFPLSNTSLSNFPEFFFVEPLNTTFLKTRGIDVDATYNFDLDSIDSRWGGNLALRAVVGWVDRHSEQFSTLAPVLEFAGWVGHNRARAPVPHWRGLYSANYTNGGFSARMQVRYIGKLKAGPDEFWRPDHIPALAYVDTTVRQRFEVNGHDTEVFLTINNLFDKVYPIWGQTTSPGSAIATIPQLYDTMLRYYTAGVRVTF